MTGKGVMLFHVGSGGRAPRNWRRKWGTNRMVSRGKLVFGIGVASAKALRHGCFCFFVWPEQSKGWGWQCVCVQWVWWGLVGPGKEFGFHSEWNEKRGRFGISLNLFKGTLLFP